MLSYYSRNCRKLINIDNSSESELMLITGISNLTLLLYSTFPYRNLFFDFVFWILPQYYVIIYPGEYHNLVGFLVSSLDFSKLNIGKRKKLTQFELVAFLRSLISLKVGVSIFAVDFSFFPRKFGKTIFYGHRLMDVGVGSYIYNVGVMSVKSSFWKRVNSIVILVVLGFIRLLCIKIFSLDVSITEYGKHSNFYFILAGCQTIYTFIKSKYNYILGYVLLLIYTYMLKIYNLDNYIFNDTERVGFFDENRETFFSFIGYISLMLISNRTGTIYFSRTKNLRSKILCLAYYTGIFFLVYKLASIIYCPSRRLCNITYVFWILYLHTFHMLIFMLFSLIGSTGCETISYASKNMLNNFIFSNLLVLMYNKMFVLKDLTESTAHILNLFYLFCCFTLPIIIEKYVLPVFRDTKTCTEINLKNQKYKSFCS